MTWAGTVRLVVARPTRKPLARIKFNPHVCENTWGPAVRKKLGSDLIFTARATAMNVLQSIRIALLFRQ